MSRPTVTLEELIEPVCRAHGVELVQVQTLGRAGATIVRVLIDRPRGCAEGLPDGSGVTLSDCTSVSRDLSTLLDVHDELLPGSYHLEVGSPGLDRPLVKAEDFVRFAGREAKIQTRNPIGDRRKFHGTLLGIEDGNVRIEQDGAPKAIPLDEIAKANLVHRF